MKRFIALLLLVSCKPAWANIDKIECPIDVPPEIVAAYFGCSYEKGKAVCPTAPGWIAPQLTVSACDMELPDGGCVE